MCIASLLWSPSTWHLGLENEYHQTLTGHIIVAESKKIYFIIYVCMHVRVRAPECSACGVQVEC